MRGGHADCRERVSSASRRRKLFHAGGAPKRLQVSTKSTETRSSPRRLRGTQGRTQGAVAQSSRGAATGPRSGKQQCTVEQRLLPLLHTPSGRGLSHNPGEVRSASPSPPSSPPSSPPPSPPLRLRTRRHNLGKGTKNVNILENRTLTPICFACSPLTSRWTAP